MCATCSCIRALLINVSALCRCHYSFTCQGHTVAAVPSIRPGMDPAHDARPSGEARQLDVRCCRLQCLLPARPASLPWS